MIAYANERPTGDEGGDHTRPSRHPHGDRDGGEEWRVENLVGEAVERFRDEHADGADREAESERRDHAPHVRPEVGDGRPLGGVERFHAHSLHATGRSDNAERSYAAPETHVWRRAEARRQRWRSGGTGVESCAT